MTPPDGIIEGIKTYLAAYSGLDAGAPLWVDYLGPEINGYAIIPIPGTKIVETYLNDGSKREFPFAFQSMRSTADDPTRIESNEFFDALSDWFEAQTLADILPAMPSTPKVKTATAIETTGCGFLMQQGPSETGIYQVQCKLTYDQQP